MSRRTVTSADGQRADFEWVDFHLHSSCSDGSDSPEEVAGRALHFGMCGFALTDHDSLSGVEEGFRAALRLGLGFVKGVEISAEHGAVEVHVVGLGVNEASAVLVEEVARLGAGRAQRFLDMAARLEKTGIPVLDFAEQTVREGGPCGRMNLAARLRELGITRSVQEGFDRFLKPGGAGYVPKARIPVCRAIEVIHSAGGLAFVAHPGLGKGLLRILGELLRFPFDGLEAYHVSHSTDRVFALLDLARERRLYVSGGSDCHGTIKGHAPEMGRVRVPLAVVRPILQRLGLEPGWPSPPE